MMFHLVKMSIRLFDGTKAYRWYARAVATGRTTLEMLAQAISDKTTVTPTDVRAVIDALWREIRRCLREGQIVELGELGNFQLTIRNRGGSETKESWRHDLIRNARILYRATNSMKSIAEGVKFTRWVNLEAESVFNAASEANARVYELEAKLDKTQRALLALQSDAVANPDDAVLAHRVIETQATFNRIGSELENQRITARDATKMANRLKANLDRATVESLEEDDPAVLGEADTSMEATDDSDDACVAVDPGVSGDSLAQTDEIAPAISDADAHNPNDLHDSNVKDDEADAP